MKLLFKWMNIEPILNQGLFTEADQKAREVKKLSRHAPQVQWSRQKRTDLGRGFFSCCLE